MLKRKVYVKKAMVKDGKMGDQSPLKIGIFANFAVSDSDKSNPENPIFAPEENRPKQTLKCQEKA